MEHQYREELNAVKGQAPIGPCYDCGKAIPRGELFMRCRECSGPTTRTKTYPIRVRRQDAMICKRCVDRHSHLVDAVNNLQMRVYQEGKERHAESVVN